MVVRARPPCTWLAPVTEAVRGRMPHAALIQSPCCRRFRRERAPTSGRSTRPLDACDWRSTLSSDGPIPPHHHPHEVLRTRPRRAPAARRARTRLRHPDADPGAGHSHGAHRRRPARRRTDRHRQDRWLRAADAAAPLAQRSAARRARQDPDPLPDPHADARARGAGRGERARLRQVHDQAVVDGHLRRRGHAAADRPPQARRRHPRRHAGTAARPCRAAHRRPEPGRDPRPRRSRPHARHGFHPRHPR